MSLKKGISAFGVFSIISGSMISSGIFILPSLAYAKVGSFVSVAYLIAGILALIGSLSVIELSTAMPKAGGDYFFINKTFGPMLGTISGFLGWTALSLKSAFAIFGISEIVFLFTGVDPMISALVFCIFFTVVNIIGVKESTFFQSIMVIGLLSLMIFYIGMGLPKVNLSFFKPFNKVEINEILITSGFVFVSFGGLLKVTTVSEEVIDPKKNIPLGIISAIAIVTLIYTLTVYVITGTLEPSVFKSSLTPVADSSKAIMGRVGYILIIIASALAFFTTANAGIMSASRYPLALSRDQLLPSQIGIISKKFKTPVYAILITSTLIYISLLLPLEMLVKAASTVILTSYVLTNISVIVFRESKISNYRPSFKVPFYPYIQIACIILFSFFIVDLGTKSIELSLAFLIGSFAIYMFYGRKKAQGKEYALLHLLKRIVDESLLGNTLEEELREIIVHRDNIKQDYIDKLIKEAKIIDIDESIDFETLLKAVAKSMAPKVKMCKKEIIARFMKRYQFSNPVVSDFLAAPHIIVEGEKKIFLTIARSKEGITFSEDEKVKAAFFFGYTEDKKILHLETVASIVTLFEKEEFRKKWLQAKNEAELKSLMILSERERFHS